MERFHPPRQETPPPREQDPRMEVFMERLTSAVAHETTQWEQRITAELPPEQHADALRRIQEAADFFIQPTEHWPQAPLQRIADTYALLPNDENVSRQDAILQHMETLIRVGFEQHWRDPEAYAAHDMGHSIRCAEHARTIVEEHPAILEHIAQQFSISTQEAQFVIESTALFHDCGYPHLNGRRKSSHAMESANIVGSPEIETLTRSIFPAEQEQQDALMTAIYESLLYHGADVAEETFMTKIETVGRGTYVVHQHNVEDVVSHFTRQGENDNGASTIKNIRCANTAVQQKIMQLFSDTEATFSIDVDNEGDEETVYIGREVDLRESDDRLIGMEYQPVDTHQESLAAMLRLADNLDVGSPRVREINQDPIFDEILIAFGGTDDTGKNLERLLDAYADANISVENMRAQLKRMTEKSYNPQADQLNTKSEIIHAYKKYIVESVLAQHPDIDSERRSRLRHAGEIQLRQNLFHMGGHKTVEAVQFSGTTATLTLRAEAMEQFAPYSKLETYYDEKGNRRQAIVPVPTSQIFRVERAMQAIRIDGTPITVKAVRDDGVPIAGPSHTEIALS